MEFLTKIRIELMIFLILFITYSYFHQGGGWNQNSRFAQVRSIVETGQFKINNYVLYRFVADGAGKTELRRLPLPPGLQLEEIGLNASTGDVSLFEGRLYPNKPPGTVLAAVPIYFAIYWIERALGVDPDDWWPLTINAYLTTVFSVGLLTALGCVVFYRISLRLFPLAPAWAHAASTMTFSTGTLIFPFATMMYDHNVVAALSLLSFWMLLIDKDSGFKLLHGIPVLFGAGFISGLTIVMNYSSVIFFGLLTLYAAWTNRSRWDSVSFLSGAVLPLIFLVWYHAACFGSVLASASTYQNEAFRTEGLFLFGMFDIPRLDVMIALLFSGYRGLFFTSPILVLSFLGYWFMAVRSPRLPESILFVAMFAGFLLMNSSYNNWYSGWSIGPRYLIPALSFLSLPLTVVFHKLPRVALTLATLSGVMMLLITAVDPQPPEGVQHPLTQHILPLFSGATLTFNVVGLPAIRGPVSANPIGVYESWYYPVFHPVIIERQWNSFNLGEFLWAGSLWSLLPLFVVLALGWSTVWYWSQRPGRATLSPSDEKTPSGRDEA